MKLWTNHLTSVFSSVNRRTVAILTCYCWLLRVFNEIMWVLSRNPCTKQSLNIDIVIRTAITKYYEGLTISVNWLEWDGGKDLNNLGPGSLYQQIRMWCCIPLGMHESKGRKMVQQAPPGGRRVTSVTVWPLPPLSFYFLHFTTMWVRFRHTQGPQYLSVNNQTQWYDSKD